MMSRILVIDDELSIRRLLRSMLEQAGHTVFDAPDGREGVALWRREPTDIVVTDIFMPEKDGVEVIMEMKKSPTKPKIIAMSGGGQKGLLDWKPAALLLGADQVLVKPFDQQTFLSTIQEVLVGHIDVQDAVVASSLADQRKYVRLPVFLPVSFGNGVVAQSGTVLDISREGCRIRCPDAEHETKYFLVDIRLHDPRETLSIDLAVRRWSRNGEIGVEFIRMEPDQQARLRSVLGNREVASFTQNGSAATQRHLLPVSNGEQAEV
jgi:CheY-like chemotaxis protein